jgi:hypothetical protein
MENEKEEALSKEEIAELRELIKYLKEFKQLHEKEESTLMAQESNVITSKNSQAHKSEAESDCGAEELDDDDEDDDEMPYWMEGADEEDYEEEYVTTAKKQVEPGKDKTSLGVLCCLFVPFFIAIILGCCLFEEGSDERKTFFNGFCKTLLVLASVIVLIGGVVAAIVASA